MLDIGMVQMIRLHFSIEGFLNVAVTTFCTTPEEAFSAKPSPKTQAIVWFP